MVQGRDPQLAWGFYGHRLNLYRVTEPHEGFAILRPMGRIQAGRLLRVHLERRRAVPTRGV